MNYTSIFLNSIKPMIDGLSEVKEKLDNSVDEYINLDELISFIGYDSKKIIDYPNQDIVYNYLSLISKNEKDYQAMKYLVSIKDKKIKYLPQYVDSIINLESLAISMRSLRNSLSRTIEELSTTYYEKWLNKKYYDIFSSKNILIVDSDEFSNYLGKLDIDNELKINILKEAIKSNNIYYHSDYYKDTNNYTIFINNNYLLLLNKYRSLADAFSKYIDLSVSLNDLIEYSDKYDLMNLLLAKKIWIVNKVNEDYLNEKMNELDKLIEEYNLIISLENKSYEEIKRIIKEGH